MWLVDLKYNFDCDWLIELFNNKLCDNNLASELAENRSFFKIYHNRGSFNFKVTSSLFRQGSPISDKLVSKGGLRKIETTWEKIKNWKLP